MLKFKKIIVFIVILIVIVTTIFVIPIIKINSIVDTYSNSFVLGSDTPISENISQILNSNLDQQYKKNAILIFTEGAKAGSVQRIGFYQILLYISIIINILIGVIGYLILKFIQDKKYIGISVLTSAIISLLLILIYTFTIYMSIG